MRQIFSVIDYRGCSVYLFVFFFFMIDIDWLFLYGLENFYGFIFQDENVQEMIS